MVRHSGVYYINDVVWLRVSYENMVKVWAGTAVTWRFTQDCRVHFQACSHSFWWEAYGPPHRDTSMSLKYGNYLPSEQVIQESKIQLWMSRCHFRNTLFVTQVNLIQCGWGLHMIIDIRKQGSLGLSQRLATTGSDIWYFYAWSMKNSHVFLQSFPFQLAKMKWLPGQLGTQMLKVAALPSARVLNDCMENTLMIYLPAEY